MVIHRLRLGVIRKPFEAVEENPFVEEDTVDAVKDSLKEDTAAVGIPVVDTVVGVDLVVDTIAGDNPEEGTVVEGNLVVDTVAVGCILEVDTVAGVDLVVDTIAGDSPEEGTVVEGSLREDSSEVVNHSP